MHIDSRKLKPINSCPSVVAVAIALAVVAVAIALAVVAVVDTARSQRFKNPTPLNRTKPLTPLESSSRPKSRSLIARRSGETPYFVFVFVVVVAFAFAVAVAVAVEKSRHTASIPASL